MKHETTTLMTKKAIAASLKKLWKKSPWIKSQLGKSLRTAV